MRTKEADSRAAGNKPLRKGVTTMVGQERWLVASLLALFSLGHSATSATIGFKPAVSYSVGTHPVAVATGDFDGDGKADLAIVNNGDAIVRDNGSVSILLGNDD